LYENELHIEQEELRAFPEEEREELELIYRAKGIGPDAARALVDNIMRRSDVALDTLAREELGLDPTKLGSPWVAAVSSFLAFSLGAAPVIPSWSGAVLLHDCGCHRVVAGAAAGAATSIVLGWVGVGLLAIVIIAAAATAE
jgi:VIT1/CCC1 family predicted Fe2+/Mn2+ transporter